MNNGIIFSASTLNVTVASYSQNLANAPAPGNTNEGGVSPNTSFGVLFNSQWTNINEAKAIANAVSAWLVNGGIVSYTAPLSGIVVTGSSQASVSVFGVSLTPAQAALFATSVAQYCVTYL